MNALQEIAWQLANQIADIHQRPRPCSIIGETPADVKLILDALLAHTATLQAELSAMTTIREQNYEEGEEYLKLLRRCDAELDNLRTKLRNKEEEGWEGCARRDVLKLHLKGVLED